MDNIYTFKNNKKLRYGYTTGSCAAAASKAAAIMLFRKCEMKTISIMTPKGIRLDLEVQDIKIEDSYVSCAIQKDSGDDPDVTNGILVYAKVYKIDTPQIMIDGGIGVGRVTKPGLEQPINNAAINRVPRQMIHDEVNEICNEFEYDKGLKVEISIPKGVEIAKRTFNPRLGIEGGISILGTSGIVEPMSEVALIESIKIEMRMRKANGQRHMLVTLGNYGENFTSKEFNIDISKGIKCSNFIGETIDYAVEIGLESLLFIGHIGKLIKVAGGIMNTHSKNADARMEIMAAAAINVGASVDAAKRILKCITTDEAIEVLVEEDIRHASMQEVANKARYYMTKRSYENLEIGVILFSNQFGLLAKTGNANELLSYMDVIE